MYYGRWSRGNSASVLGIAGPLWTSHWGVWWTCCGSWWIKWHVCSPSSKHDCSWSTCPLELVIGELKTWIGSLIYLNFWWVFGPLALDVRTWIDYCICRAIVCHMHWTQVLIYKRLQLLCKRGWALLGQQCVLGVHWYMKSFKFRRNSLLMLTKFTKTTDTSFVEFAQMFSWRGSEMLYFLLRRTLIVLQACDVELPNHTEGRTRVPSRSCAALCGFSVCSLWKVSKLLK
jgi:hypothetical protein